MSNKKQDFLSWVPLFSGKFSLKVDSQHFIESYFLQPFNSDLPSNSLIFPKSAVEDGCLLGKNGNYAWR